MTFGLEPDRYARQRLIPQWDQTRFAAATAVVVGVGALGILAALITAFAFGGAYFPEPMISWQGLENAAWIVRHREGLLGLGGGSAIALLFAPWAALPVWSAVGLRRRRRWGWLLGIVSSVLWLPTPAFPIGLYVLVRLMRGSTRRVFFA